ncbi:replication protein C, IncQ-type [Thiomonas sp. FB-Cd]|uniref:replication protein C, IncQ-type n=1 Tax=Thiomonas sp. FB-Cd TaxID=1158292 RepID=UPI00068D9DA6|nr:replication protein C, IncQ-type [Thiomonas sp. FB-Cd]
MSSTAPQRIVRYDPATGLSHLFRPLAKTKTRPTLHVEYCPVPGGMRLGFSAREALGMPEQTLLLALLELAQEQYAHVARDAVVIDRRATGIGQELWRAMHGGPAAMDGETLHIRTSWYELAGRCGSRGGRSQQLREEQLRRLCEVTVWEKADNLLHSVRQSKLVTLWDGNDVRLHLAVNCRLANAVMGGPYAQVSMRERLDLTTDTAQAVHAFLSTTLRAGRSLKVRLETLMQRLWDDKGVTPEGTLRARRKAVRDSLMAIGGLHGWHVEWPRPDMADITRRAVRSRQNPGTIGNARSAVAALDDGSQAISPTLGESFDATRFMSPVADSPSPCTIDNADVGYRQRGDA